MGAPLNFFRGVFLPLLSVLLLEPFSPAGNSRLALADETHKEVFAKMANGEATYCAQISDVGRAGYYPSKLELFSSQDKILNFRIELSFVNCELSGESKYRWMPRLPFDPILSLDPEGKNIFTALKDGEFVLVNKYVRMLSSQKILNHHTQSLDIFLPLADLVSPDEMDAVEGGQAITARIMLLVRGNSSAFDPDGKEVKLGKRHYGIFTLLFTAKKDEEGRFGAGRVVVQP